MKLVYITTVSPIRDERGISVANLGVDIKIENISMLTRTSLNYFLCFVGVFLLMIIIRYSGIKGYSLPSMTRIQNWILKR